MSAAATPLPAEAAPSPQLSTGGCAPGPHPRRAPWRSRRRAARTGARFWAVVAGGGTIGHLTPGLATADALVARGCPPDALHFVGSERGVEAARLPATGYPLTLLPGRGLRRRLTPSNLAANLAALVGLAGALVRAFGLLRRERPAVVLATGGYASAPCALAAILSGFPVVVAEQNAVLGSANRLALRLGAEAVALSFPDTALPGRLPGRPRRGRRRAGPDVALTGNPVRAEMLAVDRAQDRDDARRRLGVPPGRSLLVVYGGSLGAERLNRALVDACRRWHDRDDLVVRHVVGDRDWDRAGSSCHAPERPGGLRYQRVRYEGDLPSCLAAADLVVARAGASTVAELTAVGVPSVLVPLPGAPGDHQTANARHLAAAGAAVLAPDRGLDGVRLAAIVDPLLADPARLGRMAAAAAGLGRRGAADAVAALLVEHARRPPPGDAAPGDAAPREHGL